MVQGPGVNICSECTMIAVQYLILEDKLPSNEAQKILGKHRIEKLPIVDDKGYLKGLITIKDIEKAIQYPNSAKDANGRLLVGAAVGVSVNTLERVDALVKAKVDIIVENVMSQVKAGDIILMHDIYENTYEAAKIIIERLHAEGYQLVTVSELLGNDLRAGTKYSRQ